MGGKTMSTIPLDVMWSQMLEIHRNDLSDAISTMKTDLVEMGINDSKVAKLLRLASCSAAPVGEKMNASKMAFKFMVDLISTKEATQ